MGSSREDLSAFPKDAKVIAGHQLNRVQDGLEPDVFKPMPTVGSGTAEIIVDVGDQYRVFYIAKLKSAIYVLHAFQKNSQKTSQHDIEIAAKRYRDALALDKTDPQKERTK